MKFRRDLSVLALHIAVYFATALLLTQGPAIGVGWALVFGATLVWVNLVDFRETIVPDAAVVVLLAVGGVRLFLSDDWVGGAVAGALWFGLFSFAVYAFRVWRGYDGLGFGDAKLVGGLGIWVGLGGMSLVVLAAVASELSHPTCVVS